MIDVRMQKTPEKKQTARPQPQGTENEKLSPKITVIGVGGAGCNAVNNMIATNLGGVEFIACNSDAQALSGCLAPIKIQLGETITGGLGAGANPEIGRAAAEETIDEVLSYLDDVNMVFVTAGMGGGTGTGAAPVIAKAAREKGVLTVGVVTKPFHFEGAHRMKSAESGIEEMQDYVDTLIVIPNQNLFRVANEKTTFADAFKMADTVLQSGVRGVTDLMVMPGLINLDFADVRAVMLEMGKAMMGTGESTGERRAIEAAEKAINNPLLDDVSMKGAQGVIINITGGLDMTLFEVDEACNRVRDEVDSDANIIFGSTFDESLEGTMRVSIVATGIEAEGARKTKGPSGFVYNANVAANRVTPKTSEQFADAEVAEAPVEVAAEASAEQAVEQPVAAAPSFIPPRPVEPSSLNAIQGITYPNQAPEPQHFSEQVSAAPSAPVQEQAAPVAPQPQSLPMPAQEEVKPQGLVLNPPKTPESKKRPPSLFERFAGGFNKPQEYSAKETGSAEGSGTSSDGGAVPPFASLRAERPAVQQQGNLGIEVAEAQQPKEQAEDLDIPAFLRRQAN